MWSGVKPLPSIPSEGLGGVVKVEPRLDPPSVRCWARFGASCIASRRHQVPSLALAKKARWTWEIVSKATKLA